MKSIPKKTMCMTKKLILFAIFLLTLLCAQELQSQTIVTLDYMDCFQANADSVASSRPILPKTVRSSNKTALSFVLNYDESIPDSISKSLEVATDIWRNSLNTNSDYKIKINLKLGNLPDGVDVKTSVHYVPYNNIYYPTSLYCSYIQSLPDTQNPDAVITINKNVNWYCGYNTNSTTDYNLTYAFLRSIAIVLGFGSSIHQTTIRGNEIVRFNNAHPSLFDSFLESTNGAILADYKNMGTRQNPDILKFATGQFGDVYISGLVNDSTYRMYTPSTYENGKSLIYLNNSNSLMHYSLNKLDAILQIDTLTANVLNKLGWDVNATQVENFTIVGVDIPETGITSAYTSHSFNLEGKGKQYLNNRKWTFSLQSSDGSDTVVKETYGDLNFSIDPLKFPNDYNVNINGDIYGKIIFTGDINGENVRIVYNLTLELMPEISAVNYVRNPNSGYDSYDVICKVDYKGADYLYVSLEEEYSSLLRSQFVREPYYAHFSCKNISSNYYAWIDITVENQYGSDLYTIELPPFQNNTKRKLYNKIDINKAVDGFSSIKVYDIHGLYIKTVKNLGETVGLPSGKYILNYYTGETLIKTSKLLK